MDTVKLQINKKFQPYFTDYSQRYNVYYGGRGSGKTHYLIQKLVVKGLREKRKMLFLHKYTNKLRDGIYNLTIQVLDKELNIIDKCKIQKTHFEITLPNGSVILFKGLDTSEKAKSIHGITDMLIDELTELTQDEFDALDLSLRHATASNQQIYLSYNPCPKTHWIYKHWHIQEQPNTFYLHSTYADNAFLPKAYIETVERYKETNPYKWKTDGLGLFASMDKLIYPYYEVLDFEHRDIHGTYVYGLDFGYTNDPSAFVCAKVDNDNKIIYVFSEYYESGRTNDELANMIGYRGLSKEVIIADSSEPKSIEEMKRNGIRRIKGAVKGKGSVNQGIQLIQQYKLVIHISCVNIQVELQNYAWTKDKATGEYTNTPVDKYNHILDALRYAMQSIEKPNRIKTMSKSALGI